MVLRSKILRMLLVGAFAAATVNMVESGGAQAAPVTQPVTFSTSSLLKIVNIGSGKCAEVNRFGDPSVNGDRVLQRSCDGSPVQLWAPVNVGGDKYQFVNQFSGKCLDVKDGVNADRTPIQQWDCRGGPSMTWKISPGSFGGVHQVVSQTGGRCLDVAGGSGEDGAQIQIYRCSGFGNSAQVWSFSG